MKTTHTRVTKTKARPVYRISKKIPKLLPEQIYRLLGSSIGDLFTLSDAKQLREVVRWFADSDAFWELAPIIALKSQQTCEDEIDRYLKLSTFRSGRARRSQVTKLDSRRVHT